MNKAQPFFCGILLFVAVVFFSRCHKSGHASSSQNDSSCLISSIYYTGNTETSNTTFSYDDHRRLTSYTGILKQNSVTTTSGQIFRYGVGYVLTGYINGTDTSTLDSLVLNSNGTIREHWRPGSDQLWTYIYASNGEVLQRTLSRPQQPAISPHTTLFNWSNGDLISTSDGDVYTYDTTRKVAPGDNWMVVMLEEYGNVAYTIKNAHMQTSENHDNFTYVYDASGKVISYADTATSLITYACP